MPELYVRNDVPGALMAVPATPPASVAGQTVLTGFTPQELTFIVGKHLSDYRGEHYIKNLFPTLNELKVILFAGVKIVMADFTVPGEMAQAVNATASELVKHMQPVQRESLRIVVQKCDRGRGQGRSEALDAGHRDHGDPRGASPVRRSRDREEDHRGGAAAAGRSPPAEKMKELLVFSVSEQYFALRKTLGIAVG